MRNFDNDRFEKTRVYKKPKKKQVTFAKKVLRIIILLAIVFGLIATAIVGGAVIGYIRSTSPLTEEQLQLKAFSSFVYAYDEETQIDTLSGEENRIWIDIDEVPQYLKDAFIAIEDERFYTHKGIDIRGIFRAGFTFLRGGRREGASTITQQVVKNLTGDDDVSIQRKIQEHISAV